MFFDFGDLEKASLDGGMKTLMAKAADEKHW
jgi:hypothetical protein